MPRIALAFFLTILGMAATVQAQSPAAGVPRLIPASGLLFDAAGKPITGSNVKVTFSVYAGAGDEAPLWSETLRLSLSAGRYEALIGSSSPDGIPAAVFAGGDARWLGVTADKAVAPPRSLLVSVPYALASDDASKLGGLPATAFVLKDEASASRSSSTPNGWKLAVDEEAAARAAADVTLQNNLDAEAATRAAADTTLQNNLDAEAAARAAADTALQNELDAKAAELNTKIDIEKTIRETKDTELTTKIDQTKTELNTKIDTTKAELDTKIIQKSVEQDSKLLSLKNELLQDSTQKASELDQKKTSKEEFELEKTKKQLDIDDIKQKKLEKALFDKEKLAKDFEIDDLKQKKLEKTVFDAEKISKDASISLLDTKKLDKSVFDVEKSSKDQQIQDLHLKIDAEKGRIDSLFSFTVTFAREPNGDAAPGQKLCADPTVAIGIVGDPADPLGTASPFCSPVNGAGIRADGSLQASLNGPFAAPGLSQIPPGFELMCPAGHAVVGVEISVDESAAAQQGGVMSARCRRVFGTDEVNSPASVAVPAGTTAPGSCAAGTTAAGLDLSGGLAMVCR